ncbi:MAG: hypothetical protein H6617_04960 [Bdellovibrionaceae bacterium]|nr:hypothetical protein [Bdellovibrionales bacterium]MCB9254013.1 hypothetical protein [Pseudobdellovibrionaceae bacterium]
MRALLFLSLVLSSTGFAAEKNCRLIAQFWQTSGKKVVEITERVALNYQECKLAAKQRELDSESDKNVVSTKVIFAYRAPTFSPDELEELSE